MLGGGAHREFVHIGAPQKNRSLLFQFLDDGGVVRGNVIFKDLGRRAYSAPLDEDVVLYGNGNTGERLLCAARDEFIGLFRLFPRTVRPHLEVSVEFVVFLSYGGQIRIGQLESRVFFCVERLARFRYRETGKIHTSEDIVRVNAYFLFLEMTCLTAMRSPWREGAALRSASV